MTIMNMVGGGGGETPLEIQPFFLGTYTRDTSNQSILYYEATATEMIEGYLPSNILPIKGLGIVSDYLPSRTSYYYNDQFVGSGTLTNKLIEWGFDKFPDGAYTLYYYCANSITTEYGKTTSNIKTRTPETISFAVTNGVLTVTNHIDVRIFGSQNATNCPVYLWFNKLIKQ